MIGIVDYGAGNLGSVMNAFGRLGIAARFVRGPDELSAAAFSGGGLRGGSPFERVVFPGDGHFATAMGSLEKSGYADAIRAWIQADKPFLGICIGLQLLFDSSDEAPPVNGVPVKGLGILRGTVKLFPGRKVPLIGWNSTETRKNTRLFAGTPDKTFFYYIHSYYVAPENDTDTASQADYYLKYCSAVERGALAAVQFHPEKSGPLGLSLLKTWAERS
ncbi:imidazole glycerol phosphate synthase subunit HisH [Treponema sp.]